MHFLYETPRAIFHRTNSQRRNDDRPVLHALSRECFWVAQKCPRAPSHSGLLSRKLCGHFIMTNPTERSTGLPCFQSLTHLLPRQVMRLFLSFNVKLKAFYGQEAPQSRSTFRPQAEGQGLSSSTSAIGPPSSRPAEERRQRQREERQRQGQGRFRSSHPAAPSYRYIQEVQGLAQLGRGFNSCLFYPAQSRGGRGVCLRFQSSLPCTNTPYTHDHSCAGCGKNDIPYDLCGCLDNAAWDDIPRCSDDAPLIHPTQAAVALVRCAEDTSLYLGFRRCEVLERRLSHFAHVDGGERWYWSFGLVKQSAGVNSWPRLQTSWF